MLKAESLSWPVKMLDKLVDAETVIGKLLEVLERMDIEYERDPQRKIQLLATLEERRDPRIADAVVRFIEDANETVRFNAVGALYAQEAEVEAHREVLLEACCKEESVRIRNRILDGFVANGWSIADRAEELRAVLPSGFTIDKQGALRKKG
jgi:hypothetical protein